MSYEITIANLLWEKYKKELSSILREPEKYLKIDKRTSVINNILKTIGFKECSKCKKKLPLSEFYKKEKSVSSICKECIKNQKIVPPVIYSLKDERLIGYLKIHKEEVLKIING